MPSHYPIQPASLAVDLQAAMEDLDDKHTESSLPVETILQDT